MTVMKRFIAVSVVISLIPGCGSGTGTSQTPAAAMNENTLNMSRTLISGTTAKNALVMLRDASQPLIKELSTTTDQNGNYSLDVSGLKAPYALKAVFANGSSNYAVSSGGGKVDINRSSSALVQLAAAGLNIAAIIWTISGDVLLLIARGAEGLASNITNTN